LGETCIRRRGEGKAKSNGEISAQNLGRRITHPDVEQGSGVEIIDRSVEKKSQYNGRAAIKKSRQLAGAGDKCLRPEAGTGSEKTRSSSWGLKGG